MLTCLRHSWISNDLNRMKLNSNQPLHLVLMVSLIYSVLACTPYPRNTFTQIFIPLVIIISEHLLSHSLLPLLSFQMCVWQKKKWRPEPGFEPGTSRSYVEDENPKRESYYESLGCDGLYWRCDNLLPTRPSGRRWCNWVSWEIIYSREPLNILLENYGDKCRDTRRAVCMMEREASEHINQ